MGFFLEEFEGLFILPVKATHADRGQNYEVRRLVNAVVGQREVAQRADGHVDEFEIGIAECESIKNPCEGAVRPMRTRLSFPAKAIC